MIKKIVKFAKSIIDLLMENVKFQIAKLILF